MGFGELPAHYDKAKHGPYDPARYYGKPDTPFGQVKLSELIAWFGRREKNPQAAVGLISRAFWRWQHRYIFPERAGIAPFFQIAAAFSLFSYYLNYNKTRNHKNYKYH